MTVKNLTIWPVKGQSVNIETKGTIEINGLKCDFIILDKFCYDTGINEITVPMIMLPDETISEDELDEIAKLIIDKYSKYDMQDSGSGCKIKIWKPNVFQKIIYWFGIAKDPRYNGKNFSL